MGYILIGVLHKITVELKSEKAKNIVLEREIEKDLPKVIFANAVNASDTGIMVGELAKLICQNGRDIGQNRLFEWLRQAGYLMKSGVRRNLPTQRAMNRGLFEIKETAIICSDGGISLSLTPKVTGKGQIYFLEKRKIDPTFYPVIYGANDGADWTSEKVWKAVNPSLGVTIDIEKLRAACESARQNPAEENLFRQLRLNQWVKQSVRWMPMEKWDACDSSVDPDSLKGRACYAGLDLASTTDITAFVLVFPPRDEDEKYEVLPFSGFPRTMWACE